MVRFVDCMTTRDLSNSVDANKFQRKAVNNAVVVPLISSQTHKKTPPLADDGLRD